MMKQDIRKLRKTLEEGDQKGGRRKTGWWNKECREKEDKSEKEMKKLEQREVYTKARKESKELWKEHRRNNGTRYREIKKGSRRGGAGKEKEEE
ncbi:hypothetical protein K0M31_007097 [Melipona bicolor]|uniref:Uncharacterized protein n=1 Tax=Melipona bicolor TaxID=60889 RepID=A0AA40FRN9_9HYME|nr:hypothetical protein K0M31_007097 [Melipona bicolor]